MNEIRTLCEAPQVRGLVEFYGAFYSPDSGQISIALEYMDGGSLADIVRTKKFIPEPILSVITRKVLQVSIISRRGTWIVPFGLARSVTSSVFEKLSCIDEALW